MGTLNKFLMLLVFINMGFLYSQSCIIKVSKSDSLKLEKQDNEYYEEYIFSLLDANKTLETYKVTPLNKVISKKDRIYNLNFFLENKYKKKCFSRDILFLIDNKFYKYIRTFE